MIGWTVQLAVSAGMTSTTKSLGRHGTNGWSSGSRHVWLAVLEYKMSRQPIEFGLAGRLVAQFSSGVNVQYEA
jgi:hypothetical protein